MRKDAGYPPLVTPSSQIVGTQAVFNVLMGRYKVLTGEFADLMLGYYGETHRPARSGRDRGGRQARQEGADHRPPGRPAEAGVGRAARPGARAEGLQRHRRGRADLRHVPAGGAEVLRRRAPRARRTWARIRPQANRRPRPARARCAPPVTYDVTIGDRHAQGHGRRRPDAHGSPRAGLPAAAATPPAQPGVHEAHGSPRQHRRRWRRWSTELQGRREQLDARRRRRQAREAARGRAS